VSASGFEERAMKRLISQVTTVIIVLAVIALGLGAFAWSGLYNIGADDPHWPLTYSLMQTVRDRSIHAHSKDIALPRLDDPQLILKGASHYAAMCTDCHLKPGMQDSEIRPGLYPRPPNLSQARIDPRQEFWVIKHGIKMSAMPAWGFSHDDDTIWSMVAFLQKLPDLSPAQYEELVAKAPPDEEMGGHHHHHGAGENHGAASGEGHSHEHEHGHSEGDATDGDKHDHAETPSAADSAFPMDGLKPGAVPDAEAAAQAFHTALQTGNREGTLALMAPEVTISEGGRTQSRDEYAEHHLGEDIAFLKTVKITPISLASMPMGDTAMVGSESTMQTVRGGPSEIRSREMLALKRDGTTWKIVSIRWQSGPAGNPQGG
jgi:mono/diheme cytochrome c family protein